MRRYILIILLFASAGILAAQETTETAEEDPTAETEQNRR